MILLYQTPKRVCGCLAKNGSHQRNHDGQALRFVTLRISSERTKIRERTPVYRATGQSVPDIADTVITHIMLRTLVLLAAVTATSATALSRPRVTPLVRSTPPAAEAALQLRGGGMVPADTFVKAWAAVFGLCK